MRYQDFEGQINFFGDSQGQEPPKPPKDSQKRSPRNKKIGLTHEEKAGNVVPGKKLRKQPPKEQLGLPGFFKLVPEQLSHQLSFSDLLLRSMGSIAEKTGLNPRQKLVFKMA